MDQIRCWLLLRAQLGSKDIGVDISATSLQFETNPADIYVYEYDADTD
jgi:hypothetical protein